MKKVAILTTHRANNFGAMLQAFSLVEACNELGSDAKILDWRCQYYEKLYHRRLEFSISPRAWLRNTWRLLIERSTWERFDAFRSSLRISDKIVDRAELEAAERKYDVFITGSDQVWNPVNSAPGNRPEIFDRAYLLDFVKTKSKNSYAASIGVSEIKPDYLLPEFISAWKTFNIISTREHEGASYVERLSGHTATPVLDPVLIHDADWWIERCNIKRNDCDGGLFLYNVNRLSALDEKAKEMARKSKMRIVMPIVPGQPSRKNLFGCAMGPLDFVSAIHSADYVFSSSFHCSAFAMIFKKKLYLARKMSPDRPNSRYDSLFIYADVRPELVERKDNVEILFVDFSKRCDIVFANEREQSLSVLQRIVEG